MVKAMVVVVMVVVVVVGGGGSKVKNRFLIFLHFLKENLIQRKLLFTEEKNVK